MLKKRISPVLILTGIVAAAGAAVGYRSHAAGTGPEQGAEKRAPLQAEREGLYDPFRNIREAQERALEGTWRVTVTPGAGGPPPSQSYHTYARGGGLIQSNLTEGNLPGQGTWVRVGHNEFTMTFEKFLPVNFITGQTGVFIFRVKETIKVDGDTYTGTGQGELCNAAGAQCISLGCAATSAKKMKAEGPTCR
jgi:hypothetical protein